MDEITSIIIFSIVGIFTGVYLEFFYKEKKIIDKELQQLMKQRK